jgi:glycerol-3-phosphate dehydrogenase (NAD(P)+)
MSRIAVLGSGAWGTALAISLARKSDNEVTLWSHRPEAAEALKRERENVTFLPGFPLLDQIRITGDDREAVEGTGIVIFAVPSQHSRSTMARVGQFIAPGDVLVSATKGIEDGSFLRMSEVLRSSLFEQRREEANYNAIGALSGPSFAQEVAAGMPTAVTIAFTEPVIATLIQKQFSSETLRLYTNNDLIGVEMGGALKNVIAIAAGVVAGQGLGLNSAAGLITRGIAEMTRLAVAAGGQRETLSGLSGVGDLVLTCTGSLSRNRTVGFELGRGRKLPEILASLDGKVAEGVRTTRAALGLARKLGVEMPITEQMEQILDHGKDPKTAIRELMMRPGRDE